ncbi:Arc family DNA-binding protein [Duganella phyllosphaerae]|uniref:Arc family DNA-binding protein n=1 Tax=Duganella phyllosphaerae TaxID=762836 RepID=UPI00114CA320
MQTPPTQKSLQQSYIKTALRLPPALKEDLADAAARAGHSLNAEIIARCQALPLIEQIRLISAENAELRALLRELLATLSTK